MNNLKWSIGAVVLLAIVLVGAYFGLQGHNKSLFSGTTPSGFTALYATESLGSPIFALGGAITGGSAGLNYQTQSSIGTFNTSSSTLFNVANPTSATSTAYIWIPTIKGQATTTSFSVGTTTTNGSVSYVPGTLVASSSIATTTQNTILSGQTTNLGSGEISSGSGSTYLIVVGPNERLAGYATSTAGGAGAQNYSAGLTGQYDIIWNN